MKINAPWFTLSRHDDDGTQPPPADQDPSPDDGAKPEKKLTQADVDRIVAERLSRQKAQYADYDGLKAKAAKLAELEAANATEAEKLASKADAAEKRAAEAVNRSVRSEVKALADGFTDREDAILNLGDLTQYVKDGDIDTDAIEAKLAEVLTCKPHLAKAAAPPPVRQPAPDPSQGRGGDPQPPDFRTAAPEEFAAELAKYGIRPRT